MLTVCRTQGQAFGEKSIVGSVEPLPQSDPRPPAERMQSLTTHEFPGRPVWLGTISSDLAFKADDITDEPGKFEDGHVVSPADVDMFGGGVELHDVNERIGAIIDV